MKMLTIVTDTELVSECAQALHDHGVSGYSLLPEVFGVGRSGEKMGNRLHPGASSMILAVIDDGAVAETLRSIRECVARHAPNEATHAWVVPVEASLHDPRP
jgi:nitrogen regulatory protein PII